MKISLNLSKVISEINKIKIPYITNFIAFLSSFNLWFLNIYFFKPNFLTNHGLIITLMLNFSITMSWFLINTITTYKDAIYSAYSTGILENPEDILINKNSITLLIFMNIILNHSLFFFLSYIFDFQFVTLICVSFGFTALKYLLVDSLLNKAYRKKNIL